MFPTTGKSLTWTLILVGGKRLRVIWAAMSWGGIESAANAGETAEVVAMVRNKKAERAAVAADDATCVATCVMKGVETVDVECDGDDASVVAVILVAW